MNVAPAAVFEAVIETGETGLAGTIGVAANDNQGVTSIAFSTAAITEIAPGVYSATGRTAPASEGQYTLIWRLGAAGEVLGVEDLTVTYSAPGDPVPAAPSSLYVTVTEMKTALSLGAETYADDDLTASAEAASRAVDGICDTQFYVSGSQARKYTPVSEEYVLIDGANSIATVTAGWAQSGQTTLVNDTDYARIADPRPGPFTALRALNGFRFPRGVVNGVVVTGTWGWTAPPADVKRATLILATRIFKRSREAPFGVIGFDEGGLSVRMPGRDPDVLTLLQPYIRNSMIE